MDFSLKFLLLLSFAPATLALPVEGDVVGQQPVGSPPSPEAEFGKPLTQEQPPSRVHPIILVPGDGGSQIEARLHKTEVGSQQDFKTLLDGELLIH